MVSTACCDRSWRFKTATAACSARMSHRCSSPLITFDSLMREWRAIFSTIACIASAPVRRIGHILEMTGESFRLKQKKPKPKPTERHPLDLERPQVPPVDFGDKLLTQRSGHTFAPPHGRFLLHRWHRGAKCSLRLIGAVGDHCPARAGALVCNQAVNVLSSPILDRRRDAVI